MKERNFYIDFLKAFAIICVVIGHCIQFGSGAFYLNYQLFYSNPIFIFIYSFHMPFFMLLSGYLFANSAQKYNWITSLKIKFKQLIIPLFFWCIVLTIKNSIENPEGILWNVPNAITQFVNTAWFLWAIWWCSFIVIITKRFLKDSLNIYFIVFLFTFITPDDYGFHLCKFVYPFFIMGYLFYVHDLKKYRNIYLHPLCIIIIITSFIIMLSFYDINSYIYTSEYTVLGKNIPYQIQTDLFRMLIGFLGSCSVMYLLIIPSRKLGGHLKSLLSYIGQNTLGIYLVSTIILNGYINKIIVNLTAPNVVYIIIESIVIIAISLIINFILKSNKVTKFMFLGSR